MNCAECKELLVAHVEGLLDASQSRAVERHLKDCRTCQGEAGEITRLHDRLAANGSSLAQSDLENKVLNRIIREQKDRLKAVGTAGTSLRLRRIIMRNPITKLAIAAVILVAAIAGVYLPYVSTGNAAFGEVIQPFLTARTATFKVTITGKGVPTQEFDGMFMEPCRMRHTQAEGGTVIVDLEKGRFVTLIPQLKQAIVLEMVNIPEEPGSLNFFQEIRMRIIKAQPFDDESVKLLGEKELEGQPAVGYHVQKAGLDATVWANRKSKTPIQIEVFQEPMTVTMSNIVFDVPLDEALFDTNVPAGYNIRTIRRDMSEPNEKDFIESFRTWAEHMDGRFPSKLDQSVVNEFVQYQQQKMKEKRIEPSFENITQMQQTIVDMTHGFPFVAALHADSDWHYFGKDVKFGDADKAVFWYRPKDSPTYRVIYGDLSVKDVAPENLPK